MEKELLEEFVELYRSDEPPLPNDTDGIIILTGPIEPLDENISRIRRGLKALNELGREIPLVYSGVTEEEDKIMAIMANQGVPVKLTYFQDCGKVGVANTKTQFEKILSDPLTNDMKSLVIVTSTWHIPRVKRTAGKFLSPETKFVVVRNPEDWQISNPLLNVVGEIKRIIEYSTRGYILARPR